MAENPNTWADISSVAQSIQEDALFVVRELGQMQGLVTMFRDATGGNPRVGYEYSGGTVVELAETDDMESQGLTPAAAQTLTPGIIGAQYFVTDLRASSEAPENIITDAGRDLGFIALDKVESDLVGEMANLTGGTVGAAGTAITWGYVSAAIAQARNANKSTGIPLSCVIHGYQAAVLAKTASVAGATSLAQAPGVTDEITRRGITPAFNFMGVPIYQVFASPNASDDFTGGVFPKDAIAVDWRRAIRVEPERDASRGGGGTEFNMTAVYAHGVWRPAKGIKMVFDATAPTS